ncbi:calcium-binding protein [Chitinimonas koreensis]|uniref:calcium-binding protein n=1 Tax=Chitinimonas koreensis TaxID=356302 RepID=UPI001654B1E8|nr:calcium-binding protein [Chitinimonas koreensis]QNM95296.1 calcium-binding protein [Chitinimonas koreensis]
MIESTLSAAEIDLVQSSVNFTLGANLEQLQLLGAAGLNGFGNGLDNLLTGNAGNNLLSGGAGKDTLVGGLGNDTYVVDSTGDVVVETSALATEVDTVRSSVNFTLGANVENLQLEGNAGLNGFGNALANVLTGNAGNNVLGGGAGKDTLIGGLGDDSYQVDDAGDLVVETSTLATEIDTVQSTVNYTLGANVEKLVLLGGSGLNGFGNGLNNVLSGNAGNNLLSGGAGADTLIGGAGSDIYLVDDVADQAIETVTAAQDIDTVRASVDFTLGDNLEQLQLQGDANLAGQGNGLANALTGNAGRNQLSGWAGNDTLDGGLGADTLVGGTGNDLYQVDNAGDLVVETSSLAAEIDVVHSSVNFALGANVESLRLLGAAGLNGIGNALDNQLTGNAGKNQLSGAAGADTLDGGLGADVMTGGLGNDSYWVDDSGDIVVETSALASEIDTVNATVNFTLGANLEKLQLQGSSGLNGFGNALDNEVRGNAGNNRLGGGAGADTLAGGAGTDVLTGGAGNDTYLFGRGDGLDTVVENDGTAANQDTVLLQAGIALNQLRFSRSGNDLEVGLADTTDRLRVQDWYLGTDRHVERFQTANGDVLLDSQVDALVQSMAGFVAKPASHSIQPARIDEGMAFQLAPHRYLESRPMFGQLER